MTVDEIYEAVKDEKMTWVEVIKFLYAVLFKEGYIKALEDVEKSSEEDAVEFGKSRFIGIENLKVIHSCLKQTAEDECKEKLNE